MDFFYKEPFIHAHTYPPPIIIGCVHNIAMLAFPQEIISHYTTGNIEGNACRCASDLISVDVKHCSG